MAQPTTSTFGNFLIKLGDGATPTEAFTPVCGLTSKGLDISNSTSSTMVPDCADEDAPAYEETLTKSQSYTLKGSGVFGRESQKDLLNWADSGLARNVRVYPGKAVAGDVEYFVGPAILKTFGLSVAKGDTLSQNMDIVFTKKPTKVLKV